MRYRLGVILLASLFVATSSWAWFRGGFRGGGVGVYVGPGPWWGYGPLLLPPITILTLTTIPYYVPQEQQPPQQAEPDDSRHNLKFLNDQIAQARDRTNFDYDDGDISRGEHEAELHRLVDIKREAKLEAKLNGGYLTGDQERNLLTLLRNGGSVSADEPSAEPVAEREPQKSGRELKRVTDEMGQLHAMLDKKLSDGDITKAQHDSTAYISVTA